MSNMRFPCCHNPSTFVIAGKFLCLLQNFLLFHRVSSFHSLIPYPYYFKPISNISTKSHSCPKSLQSKTTTLFSENEDTILSSSSSSLPKVSIEYCTGCRWMLRAAWNAQELLTTFQDDIHSVTLIPSKPPSPGGTFVSIIYFLG